MAITATTKTSQTEEALYHRGVRFYVTTSGVTTGGGTDVFALCAVPPNGGPAIPIASFSGANLLAAAAGTFVFDFYPSAGAGFIGTPGYGNLKGAAGICVPYQFACQVTLGAGNTATVVVDAELLP